MKSNNALGIYLMKSEHSAPSQIFKDLTKLSSVELKGQGTLYYGSSFKYTPTWVASFFGAQLDSVQADLFNSFSRAVLLADPIKANGASYIFAVPFGFGHTLLNRESYEERFGLKVALNVLESTGLRKIDKKNLSSYPRNTSEQLSRPGEVSDFGIDIEQDLIQSITGGVESSRAEVFGTTITGKTAASLSAPVTIANLRSFLTKVLERYLSKEYKKQYDWIDHIQEVAKPSVVASLNDELMRRLNKREFGRTWMAVPEIMDWHRVKGFTYSRRSSAPLYPDVDLDGFLTSLSDVEQNNLTLQRLKAKSVYWVDSESELRHEVWSAYQCLYSEVDSEATAAVFLLTNGKWYEISKSFSDRVKREFKAMVKQGMTTRLPDYDTKLHQNEGDYNKWVEANQRGYTCLDKKMITFGDTRSKIEFCDLMTARNLIHVKHYGQSSVLSHLWNQGLVSGELFVTEQAFREKVRAIAKSHNPKIPVTKPNPADYLITFAVISKKDKAFDIPFFSKVSFRAAKRRLELYGYRVNLTKIDQV